MEKNGARRTISRALVEFVGRAEMQTNLVLVSLKRQNVMLTHLIMVQGRSAREYACTECPALLGKLHNLLIKLFRERVRTIIKRYFNLS